MESTDGLTWQRRGPSQLDLPTGKARVVALRWAAAHGGTLMIAGEVTRTVVRHHGKRKVRFVNETRAVWRSRDNGAHWWRANPPVNRRATGRLTGLAATGSGFVAIRPGHASRHARAAVAYVWGHGSTWRYAGKLKARRHASLYVRSVAGSDQGAVVSATTRHHRVALVSAHGRSWHRAADLGRSSATAITGATVGPGGNVVAAGRSRRGSFLLARDIACRSARQPWRQRRPRASASTASASDLPRRSASAMPGRPASAPPGRSASTPPDRSP